MRIHVQQLFVRRSLIVSISFSCEGVRPGRDYCPHAASPGFCGHLSGPVLTEVGNQDEEDTEPPCNTTTGHWWWKPHSHSNFVFVCFVFFTSDKPIFKNILYSPALPKAPAGINPLEHEELPMSVQRLHQNVRPTLPAAPPASTEPYQGVFRQVKALPLSFSINSDSAFSLYRARVDNKNVILRVLKGTAPLGGVLYFIKNRFNGRWWYLKQTSASLFFSQKYTNYCTCCVFNCEAMFLFPLRNSHQQWEAAIFGLCVLPVGIRAAPILAYAAGCDFSAAPTGDGDGGAAAPRSARVPVEVSAGRREASCLEMIVDISMRSVTSKLQFNSDYMKTGYLVCNKKPYSHVFIFSSLHEGRQLRVFAWHNWAENLHHGKTSGLCCGWLN